MNLFEIKTRTNTSVMVWWVVSLFYQNACQSGSSAMNFSWTEHMRKRAVLAISGLVFLFTVLSLRLLEVQVGKHDYYFRPEQAANHTFRKMVYA
ncbi:MAG: hypothetical protein R3F23_03575 [Verrucomicrobiia bacterium]